MKTKKIIADSMPLALKRVRQELGENAIIVNTRPIKTGGIFGLFGKLKYEVTAYSIDRELTSPEPRFLKPANDKSEKHNNDLRNDDPQLDEENSSVFYQNPQKLYTFYSQNKVESVKPLHGAGEMETIKPTDDLQDTKEKEEAVNSARENIEEEKPLGYNKNIVNNEHQLLDELQQMRKMMMNFMIGEKVDHSLPSGLSEIVIRLKQQSVSEQIVEFLLNSLFKKYESLNQINENVLRNEIYHLIKEIIQQRIPESNTIQTDTRIINVVGPTGVGKTTSIAKLATEQVLRQKRRVAMITTDVYRIGAVEQLKTYAGILNIPIEVVHSANELDIAIEKLKHYDLIYMDTTGRNYKEIKHRESINEYLNHPLKSEHYLVMSLTSKFEDMQILLDEFLNSPIKKLILTKFDETTSYGSILNIAYMYPYQLAYMTNGQSVPEDITAIDATQIAKYLLGEA